MTPLRTTVLTALVCLASADVARAACDDGKVLCELTITKDANGYHLTGYPADKIYHTKAADFIEFKFYNQTGERVGIRIDDFKFNKKTECPAWFSRGRGGGCSGLQDDVDNDGEIHLWAYPWAKDRTKGKYNFTFYVHPPDSDWKEIKDPELEIDRMGLLPFALIALALVAVVGFGLTLLVRALQRRRNANQPAR